MVSSGSRCQSLSIGNGLYFRNSFQWESTSKFFYHWYESESKTGEDVIYRSWFRGGFWDNRLYLDFTYYKTDSRNQILKLATTAASGYTSQVRNAGHIRNRGYEIQLGAVPIQTSKGFRWNLDLNYGANSSKVVKLDDEGLITSYQLYSSGIQILASVGEAYGTLFGTSYVRDANGNVVVDANGLPKISTTNKTLGKFTPDWTGGISNTFSYRSLSLSFLIDASVGGSIFPTLIKLENIPVY